MEKHDIWQWGSLTALWETYEMPQAWCDDMKKLADGIKRRRLWKR